MSMAFACAAALVAFSVIGSAGAADLPVKAPPKEPVVAPINWSGFYVGANIGYSWGRAPTDAAGTGTSQSFQSVTPPFPGSITNIAFASASTARINGPIGGLQTGYNFQFNRWVVGLEADIQVSGEHASGTSVGSFSSPQCIEAVSNPPAPLRCTAFAPLSGTGVTNYEGKIDWLGTVRGRVGALVTGQILLYATGGFAYGEVNLSGGTALNGSIVGTGVFIPAPVFIPLTPTVAPFSRSKINLGYTVGAGIEAKFAASNWSWKLEYLYVDLGSLDTASSFSAPLGGFSTLTGAVATHTRFTDNIVRVGLNYQIGGPVVARY